MKTHRFFVKQDLDNKKEEITISDHGIAHQVKNVLRLKKGDPIILLDGNGTEFHGKLRIITNRELNISKEKIKFLHKKGKTKIHLLVSLIKKDKFEWVLQKTTELGVSRITPIVSDRTEKLNLNMDRADKIVREASEQSERADIPFVDEPISLKEAVSICETPIFVLDLEGERIDVTQMRETYLASPESDKDICVFVGPEGGWSEKDWEEFNKKEYKKIILGDQVLRAETASIAVCSLLLLG